MITTTNKLTEFRIPIRHPQFSTYVKLCGALTLVLLPAALVVRADQVDEYVSMQMQLQHIPGLSLAVVRDGQIVKTKGYGLANLELEVPAKPETAYELASATKPFVAEAALLLVQDGKIGLDDKIAKYLENPPNAWADITLRHLLTHTSGIPDYAGVRQKAEDLFDYVRLPRDPNIIIKSVADLPLRFSPGSKWDYSNTGYVLLAMIIEKVSGQRYDLFLEARVFKPLGMTATCRDDWFSIIPNRVSGYGSNGNEFFNADHLEPPSWSYGDEGVVSTALDLAKWEAAFSTHPPLALSSCKAMYDPVKLSDGSAHAFGLGWHLAEVNGHRQVFHTGGRPGVATVIARYPDDRLSVVVLANLSGANTLLIALKVAGMIDAALLPPDYSVTASAPPASDTQSHPVPITVTVQNTGGKSANDLIDLEIQDSSGRRAGQQVKEGESFAPGETKTFTFTWTPVATGKYTVNVGVFRANWMGQYLWQSNAASITVK